MFCKNVFLHKSSAMLLVVRNHTFLFIGGITNTTSLVNRMVNKTTHVLNSQRIKLLAIIHHKKMPM
jgi:hypothetical protein